MSDLYDKDGYTWAMQQADALRRRSANEIDWDNVAEEIESVGKSEARELESRYVVLLTHLLKWLYQPQKRSASWEVTIKIQRISIGRNLGHSPGLKPLRGEMLEAAYRVARLTAANETELSESVFPEANPFTLSQAMDESFWPEPSATE